MPHALSEPDRERLDRLIAAEARGLALLDEIEAEGFVAPHRSERDIERDIRALAATRFGVEAHWHKRIVRSGPNTLAVAADNPPDRIVGDDDIVFLDLGPVFDDWEADVGRSYALGRDPRKQALCAELPRQFDAIRARWLADPAITGAALYAFACASAEQAGWRFGGRIAGHIVSEFPHAHLPDDRDSMRIAPGNPAPLGDPDAFGRARFWIGEVHLVDPAGAFGGFYERLLLP